MLFGDIHSIGLVDMMMYCCVMLCYMYYVVLIMLCCVTLCYVVTSCSDSVANCGNSRYVHKA